MTSRSAHRSGGESEPAPIENPRKARASALRMLALRRLTRAQLWSRLERKGFSHDSIADAVESCRRDGYLDDKLFAELYVATKRASVGDARLVGDLVQKGIDRILAQAAVATSECCERERAVRAFVTLRRRRPTLDYSAAGRGLERLGFPASLIYSVLREHIASEVTSLP